MTPLRKTLSIVFAASFWHKIIAFIILIGIGITLQWFLALFFITFLFAYIFLELWEMLTRKLVSWSNSGKKDKAHRIVSKYAKTNSVVTILYILFVSMVIFIFSNILPQILTEIREFLKSSPMIAAQGQDFIRKIELWTNLNLWLDSLVSDILSKENLESVWQKTISYITNAGIILTKFMIALILSYIFIMERAKIERFLLRIKNGNFAFLYEEWAIIARKIGSGFGPIFKAQSIIALVNAILTSIWLLIISFLHWGTTFPYIFTLSVIVFIFGFIPVFGTFLSGIPIIIIGYGYGVNANDSLIVVLAIISMILFVHAVEAYYLNPKIVSSYVHFPVFITFIILLISEHFFWLIGLLIGVPLFLTILSFMEDFDRYINEIQVKIKDTP